MKPIALASLATLALVSGPVYTQDAATTELALPRYADVVDAQAGILVEAGVVPALVVGIVRDGVREYHSYGTFSSDDARVPDEHTLFEIGSITKTFTAALLAEGQVRGELAIDDLLGAHLPDGIEPPTHGDVQPTLGQLSDHTAGFAALPTNFGMTSLDDPYALYTEELLWEFLDGHTLQRAPGELYEYSNLAVGLLGTVVARAAGRTFPELVASRITGPLEMPDTVVELSDDQASRFAPPHQAGGAPSSNWHFQALAGAGALRSTAVDMLTWAEAQMDTAASPLPEALPLTHAPRKKLPAGPTSVALGWHIAGDRNTLLHSGGTNGYRTALFVSPKLDVAVIVLANATEERISLVAEKILTGIMGGSPEPIALKHTVTLTTEQVAPLVGSYSNPFVGTLVVTAEGSRLYAKLGPQDAYEVFPTSATRFFYRIVPAELRFELEDDNPAGTLTLYQGGQELKFTRVAP